jgi:hypothetical protein
MAKDHKGRIIRRLADMGIYPRREHYKPPIGARKDRYDWPLCDENAEPSVIDKLIVRTKDYRGKIVDFAVMQIRVVDGEDKEIARIDCCGGTIHRHFYDRNGTDLLDHDPICAIPLGEKGQELINERFPEALKLINNEWEANVRRWSGDEL